MRDLTIRENFQLLMGGNRKRIHRKLKGGDPFSMVTAAIISGAVAYQTKDLILGRVGVGEDLVLNIEQPSAKDIDEYFEKKRALEKKIIEKFGILKTFAFSHKSSDGELKFPYSEINSNDNNKVRLSIISVLGKDKSSNSGETDEVDSGKDKSSDSGETDEDGETDECSKPSKGDLGEENPHHPKSIFDYEEILCKLNEYDRVLHQNFVDGEGILGGGGQKIGTMLDILLNGVQ